MTNLSKEVTERLDKINLLTEMLYNDIKEHHAVIITFTHKLKNKSVSKDEIESLQENRKNLIRRYQNLIKYTEDFFDYTKTVGGLDYDKGNKDSLTQNLQAFFDDKTQEYKGKTGVEWFNDISENTDNIKKFFSTIEKYHEQVVDKLAAREKQRDALYGKAFEARSRYNEIKDFVEGKDGDRGNKKDEPQLHYEIEKVVTGTERDKNFNEWINKDFSELEEEYEELNNLKSQINERRKSSKDIPKPETEEDHVGRQSHLSNSNVGGVNNNADVSGMGSNPSALDQLTEGLKNQERVNTSQTDIEEISKLVNGYKKDRENQENLESKISLEEFSVNGDKDGLDFSLNNQEQKDLDLSQISGEREGDKIGFTTESNITFIRKSEVDFQESFVGKTELDNLFGDSSEEVHPLVKYQRNMLLDPQSKLLAKHSKDPNRDSNEYMVSEEGQKWLQTDEGKSFINSVNNGIERAEIYRNYHDPAKNGGYEFKNLWQKDKTERSSENENIVNVFDEETGKEISKIKEERVHNPGITINNEQIKSYRLLDIPNQVEPSSHGVHFSFVMQYADGTNMHKNKALFSTVHFNEKGELVEFSTPKPVLFHGKDDKSPAYMILNGKTIMLGMTKGQFLALQRQVEKNKSIEQNREVEQSKLFERNIEVDQSKFSEQNREAKQNEQKKGGGYTIGDSSYQKFNDKQKGNNEGAHLNDNQGHEVSEPNNYYKRPAQLQEAKNEGVKHNSKEKYNILEHSNILFQNNKELQQKHKENKAIQTDVVEEKGTNQQSGVGNNDNDLSNSPQKKDQSIQTDPPTVTHVKTDLDNLQQKSGDKNPFDQSNISFGKNNLVKGKNDTIIESEIKGKGGANKTGLFTANETMFDIQQRPPVVYNIEVKEDDWFKKLNSLLSSSMESIQKGETNKAKTLIKKSVESLEGVITESQQNDKNNDKSDTLQKLRSSVNALEDSINNMETKDPRKVQSAIIHTMDVLKTINDSLLYEKNSPNTTDFESILKELKEGGLKEESPPVPDMSDSNIKSISMQETGQAKDHKISKPQEILLKNKQESTEEIGVQSALKPGHNTSTATNYDTAAELHLESLKKQALYEQKIEELRKEIEGLTEPSIKELPEMKDIEKERTNSEIGAYDLSEDKHNILNSSVIGSLKIPNTGPEETSNLNYSYFQHGGKNDEKQNFDSVPNFDFRESQIEDFEIPPYKKTLLETLYNNRKSLATAIKEGKNDDAKVILSSSVESLESFIQKSEEKGKNNSELLLSLASKAETLKETINSTDNNPKNLLSAIEVLSFALYSVKHDISDPKKILYNMCVDKNGKHTIVNNYKNNPLQNKNEVVDLGVQTDLRQVYSKPITTNYYKKQSESEEVTQDQLEQEAKRLKDNVFYEKEIEELRKKIKELEEPQTSQVLHKQEVKDTGVQSDSKKKPIISQNNNYYEKPSQEKEVTDTTATNYDAMAKEHLAEMRNDIYTKEIGKLNKKIDMFEEHIGYVTEYYEKKIEALEKELDKLRQQRSQDGVDRDRDDVEQKANIAKLQEKIAELEEVKKKEYEVEQKGYRTQPLQNKIEEPTSSKEIYTQTDEEQQKRDLGDFKIYSNKDSVEAHKELERLKNDLINQQKEEQSKEQEAKIAELKNKIAELKNKIAELEEKAERRDKYNQIKKKELGEAGGNKALLKEVKEVEKQFNENDKTIKDGLDKQKKDLEKRLEEKSKKQARLDDALSYAKQKYDSIIQEFVNKEVEEEPDIENPTKEEKEKKSVAEQLTILSNRNKDSTRSINVDTTALEKERREDCDIKQKLKQGNNYHDVQKGQNVSGQNNPPAKQETKPAPIKPPTEKKTPGTKRPSKSKLDKEIGQPYAEHFKKMKESLVQKGTINKGNEKPKSIRSPVLTFKNNYQQLKDGSPIEKACFNVLDKVALIVKQELETELSKLKKGDDITYNLNKERLEAQYKLKLQRLEKQINKELTTSNKTYERITKAININRRKKDTSKIESLEKQRKALVKQTKLDFAEITSKLNPETKELRDKEKRAMGGGVPRGKNTNGLGV